MGVDVDDGLDFLEDNNESSEKDASNERDASYECDPSIGFESSLGNSGVASFPLEFNSGTGCMGYVKGDPIGDKLTSHASSCRVCSGVFGLNPVDSLLSAFATDSLGGVVGGSIPVIRSSCWVGALPLQPIILPHFGWGPLGR